MDACKELHEAIAEGDEELVRRLLQEHPAEKHFLYDGSSALYEAFYCKEYNIATHLIHIGAKFDGSEIYDLDELEVDLDILNCLLLQYNRRPETSPIFRLISCSQSPQGLERERLTAVMSMYEQFFKSEIMKWLMKVVESVAFDIVYDFDSEDVNRIIRYNIDESEIYGLTITSSKEIFIGAKALLSVDSRKRAKVYGVVAEELCHLALNLLFENDAKPYREDDSDSEKDLRDIVLGVKSLIDRSCHIESVIVDVFTNYQVTEWECELIARVPHVIGIYGPESAKGIFQESPELLRLMNFYQQNVIPKSEMYTDPTLNTRGHRKMEALRENDLLSYKEKTIKPLKQGFLSFREFLVDEEGISVVTTNCVKLCTLQVYHELKMQYKDLFEKKCLFLSRKCLDDKWNDILDALKAKVWDYFILILDERKLTLQKLKAEYLDHFESIKTGGMKITVISCLQSFGDKFERKALTYSWQDLSVDYQRLRTHPIEYIFKGERQVTSIKKEDIPSVFQNETDILQIMSGEPFVVEDGADLESRGFILETYLKREFKVMAVRKEIVKNLPSDTIIFIYGLYMRHLENLSIDKTLVQWLKSSDEDIQRDKKIFIIEDEKAFILGVNERKKYGKKCISVHLLKNELILNNADSLDEDLKKYKKELRIKEEEMIDVLKRNKILIISDNAGCGKSTVTSSLVRRIKKHIYDSWVFRIDLWKFSLDDDFDFEICDEEEIFDEIFEMIGLENAFERWYFKQSWNQSNHFIFFDGYDEMPSKYKSIALEMISFLRRTTHVNIVITTRRHEQQELEERLNTYSHQLVPFNDAEQVNCLEKLLKWRLKYPFGERDPQSRKNMKAIPKKIKNIIKVLEREEESNLEHQELIIASKKIGLGGNLNSIRSGIDKLDLTKLVANILRKTQLEERIIEFMGIPLHLYMVANILYFDNLNVSIVADLYSLYSKFIEEKILIYVEEKEGHLKEGIEKDRMVDRVREDTFRIHTELANQLFDEGTDTKLKKEDTELCAALGIVSIHGGKALFLHQTFAEFFKAESIRTKVEKKVFIEIISEEKYEVVRSFLSCALETKGFENISEEFSNDLDFLFEILKRIRKGYFNPYIINFDDTCSVKIVKQLMKVFKLNADSELYNKFIEQLNKLINEETDESVSINSKHNAIWIGCYLNVEIIEHLINGNLKCESQLIFGFVRFAENVGEVIDVLKEFISKECESGGNEEERVLNGILEFVRTEDMYGDGLISYAISNERTEIFPCLLEYMRNILGKEKFIGEVIESTAYKEQMEWSIMKMHTNRNCKLIKEMHSKFINETDILFDFDFKRNVIWRAILNDNEDELGNSFEKVIHLFKECFGIMNLKEQLQNGNSYGQFLVHLLMKYSKNAILVKYFGLIKNVLGEEIKDILKIKDKYLSNILHSAAQNKNEINFNFLDLYLCESELKELLFGRENKLSRTCLHSAAKWNLKQLPVLINYAFELLKSEKNVLEELLLMKDKNGDTFLHLIEDSFYTSTERIKEIFNNLRSKLSDEIFKKLLRIRNENGKTFLQIDRKYKKEEIIECCKDILEKELFEELLRTEVEGKL